ncbi:glutathione-dependent formaldehyde-activating enzyme [Mycena latifolia]|nr:glutathione-dependent formaldehyde-activating enzyme [Mycena latifolia]
MHMPESTESGQPIEYRGNCHCGAFKFTLKAPELKQAYACTCSFCSRNGYLWVFPASSEDFTVVKGDEDNTLKTYKFGKHTMAHKFCPTCGTSVMARMLNAVNGPSVGINIRTLMDVDPESLTVVTSDGAATEPLYQAPEPMDLGPVPEGTTAYTGHCHCGAVHYTLLSPAPLAKARACNCSICSRDGVLWTYPKATLVSFKGLDSLAEYTFAEGTVYHGFCKVCGVAIRERFTKPKRLDTALNVRTMTGLDLTKLALGMNDGKSLLPVYEV